MLLTRFPMLRGVSRTRESTNLADAFAVFCAAFAVCSVVLIAVLDVAPAVFTPFSVALTVPLAVVLTVLSA